MRILFTNLLLLLPQPQPPHGLLSTLSANGRLVGRWVFLTLALPSTQLFLIYYKILKNPAFGRNNRKSLARPRRDKSASETEADLFLESSLPTWHLKQLWEDWIWYAAVPDSSTLQRCCFYTLSAAHLSAQGVMFCGWHLLIRVIIALVEASMPSKVEKQL